MSRRGNPYDNAKAESFMKTVKYEEVYRMEYLDLADARRQMGRFIESVYNRKRLHSALGYRSPIEFEQNARLEMKLNQTQASVFLGIVKSIDPMKCWWSGSDSVTAAPPYRLDEFPVDYSW